VTRAELAAALREHAYLEGDFVLRSGRRSRYYLDKYRFETRPDLLGELGRRITDAVREHEPDAALLAGPELGAVTLAAATSLVSGLPFVIVRNEAKSYGTQNQLEGGFEPGSLACLVEDVVTSGGAAVSAVEALREAGLRCRTAVCVVDREEGGVDALARHAVRLRPLFRVSEVVEATLVPANPHG
jgi:orotate phosphoribosyltransferase